MAESTQILLNEIRYAQRLCERTARLYRHAQTFGTFMTVLGGSAIVASLSNAVAAWVALAGAVLFAVFGAVMVAVRPTEKAVANEADARRYAQLRTAGASMSEAQLRAALDQARETDAPEVETLRDVAYNDVVIEVGRADWALPLSRTQKLLAALA